MQTDASTKDRIDPSPTADVAAGPSVTSRDRAADAAWAFYKACHLPCPFVVVETNIDNYDKKCNYHTNHSATALEEGTVLPMCLLIFCLFIVSSLLFFHMPSFDSNEGYVTFGSALGRFIAYILTLVAFMLSAAVVSFGLDNIFSCNITSAVFARVFGVPLSSGASVSHLQTLHLAATGAGYGVNEWPASGVPNFGRRNRFLCAGQKPEWLAADTPYVSSVRACLSSLSSANLSASERRDLPLVLQYYLAVLDEADRVVFSDTAVLILLKDRARGSFSPSASLRELRAVLAEENAASTESVLRKFGIQRAVDALGLKPVQSDSAGDLYRIGQPNGLACFVRVLDAVPDENGAPQVHWLSVPPFVSSPEEGVAWTYGLAPGSYSPTVRA